MEQRVDEATAADDNNDNSHLLKGIVEKMVKKPNSNEKPRQRNDKRGVVTQLSISVRKSARDLKNLKDSEIIASNMLKQDSR